jgi:hypothetical protein
MKIPFCANSVTAIFIVLSMLALDASAGGRRVPASVTVDPNPVQAGSILITKPIVYASGLSSGKEYYLQISGGYDSSIANMLGSWLKADRDGKITWPIEADTMAGGTGLYDQSLNGSSLVKLFAVSKNGTWTEAASVSINITPNPGMITINPPAAYPGTTLSILGNGASPNANLRAVWYDATNCSCSTFIGCRSCTWTPQEVKMTADAGGSYATQFTPSNLNNGYCSHAVNIQDITTGKIVANSTFSICTK